MGVLPFSYLSTACLLEHLPRPRGHGHSGQNCIQLTGAWGVVAGWDLRCGSPPTLTNGKRKGRTRQKKWRNCNKHNFLKTFENVGNLCSKHQQTEIDFSQLMDYRKMPWNSHREKIHFALGLGAIRGGEVILAHLLAWHFLANYMTQQWTVIMLSYIWCFMYFF